MGDFENIELVKQAYAALNNDNIEGFLSLCAFDIEWIYPLMEGVPYGGRWMGHEGVKRFLKAHEASEEILEWTQSNFISQGETVVVLGHYRGKPKPAGQEWETNYVDVLTIDQGKIKRFEAYFDTAAAIRSRKTKLN